MSNSLLEEAIVDAQKLRELAEQTAKNRIIEAVMPQIRDMVNRRILGESLEEIERHEEETAKSESYVKEMEEMEEAAVKEEAESKQEENYTAEKELAEHYGFNKAITNLISNTKRISAMTEAVVTIETKVAKLGILTEDERFVHQHGTEIANKIIETTEKAISLRESVIIGESTTNDSLSKRLDQSIKELRDMSRKNRSIFDFLFEGNQLNEAELKLELGEDEQLDDEVIEMLRAAGIEVEGAEEGEELEGEEEGEELEGEEEGDEPAMEEEVEEGMYGEMDYNNEAGMYEIDETLLRRELRRIRENAAAEQADQFGGGEALGDVILDIDEEDLINVLADELGKYQGVKEPMLPESRRSATPTARERQLQAQLSEARADVRSARQVNTKLQQQLTEMNLFNAKLLYANKLMQNKELTVKQQKTVVEALDNAKTLREAKLLFESLTESLARKPAAGSLKEGMVRTLGSSSKSTRSAAPTNANGVDGDRWAILAGISKG
jgi:hypothetical protein